MKKIVFSHAKSMASCCHGVFCKNVGRKFRNCTKAFSKRVSAFSLVEMLMAVLVASMLLAALAPVMTKKMTENVSVNGVGGGVNPPAGSYCWSASSGGGSSMEFDSNGNRIVKYTTEPGVYYVNFALASGGGGGGGASSANATPRTLSGGNGTQLKIEPYMDNFDVTSIIGGGGGGGGGAGVNANETLTSGPSVEKCGLLGGYVYANGYCISPSQGTATATTAASKCSGAGAKGNLNPSGKWSLASDAFIKSLPGNILSQLGITTSTNIWSTKTEACVTPQSDTRKCGCYRNGTWVAQTTAYRTKEACCSGTSYGQSITTADTRQCSCYLNGSYRASSTAYRTAAACCGNNVNATGRQETSGGTTVNNVSYRWVSKTKPSYWSSTAYGDYTCGSYYCVCAANSSSSLSYCKQGLWSNCYSSVSNCAYYCTRNCGGTGTGIKDGGATVTKTCGQTASCTGAAPTTTNKTCLNSTTSCSGSLVPASSCGTYYFYYRWNGSQWVEQKTTTASSSYDVRCVYGSSDSVTTSVFHSLSGGGGGGAPAIRSNSFDANVLNTFRQRIRENVGGYIVLEVGTGGAAGARSTALTQNAGNGGAGNRSCVLIKGADGSAKYRLCSPGGKGGGGARGAISNAHTGGYGLAGAGTAVANACYAIDYTTNSAGVTKYFNCTDAGKAGGNGSAYYGYSTRIAIGGRGAANPTGTAQVGGTRVKEGVAGSGAGSGAGGGGGSADGTSSFGAGGVGAGGAISLAYKVKYDAAGGGGGGAGNVAVIKEYRVNQAECTFVIGKGGSGGNIGAVGKNGGDTSVTCTGAGGEVFKAYGGQGGKAGTTASALGGNSAGGTAGINTTQPNPYSEDIMSLAPSKKATKTGLSGTNGGVNDATYTNYIKYVYSAGGRGGTSGAGKKGGCGGLLNGVVCSYTYQADVTPNADEIKGVSIPVGDVKFPDLKVAENYGESSSGGGGGAWHAQRGSGIGGDGLGGYACIWWEKVE